MIFAEFDVGTMLTYAAVLLGGAGTVIGVLFKLLISAKDEASKLRDAEKDRLIADLVSERKANKEIRDEAIKSALEQANYNRQRDGKPPVVIVPPVIPLSNSPSTQAQRDAADIQTAMATLAEIKRISGQAPRAEPEHAEEPAVPPQVLSSLTSAGLQTANIRDDIAKVPEKVVQQLDKRDKQEGKKSS